MKKILLLLVALSAVSFANEFTSNGKDGVTGKVETRSIVNVLEEELTFEIKVKDDGFNSTVNDTTVLLNHGTIRNGKKLSEQNEGYQEAPSVTITVTETSESQKFVGKIQYSLDGSSFYDKGEARSLPVSMGQNSNLQAKYTLSLKNGDNGVSAENPEKRSVEFTLKSNVFVENDDKVYVALGQSVSSIEPRYASFKYTKILTNPEY